MSWPSLETAFTDRNTLLSGIHPAQSKGKLQMREEKYSNWTNLVDKETGLYNRLLLVHHLNESYARARRYHIQLSCILLQANWWRGPEEYIRGDGEPSSVIRELAQFLIHNVRTGDILGRWAENEFLLLTPFTPPQAAKLAVKNLANYLRNHEFHDLPGLTIMIRAGISGLPDDMGKVRYAEYLPLIAHDRLKPIVRAECAAGDGSFTARELELGEFKLGDSGKRNHGGHGAHASPARSPVWI